MEFVFLKNCMVEKRTILLHLPSIKAHDALDLSSMIYIQAGDFLTKNFLCCLSSPSHSMTSGLMRNTIKLIRLSSI